MVRYLTSILTLYPGDVISSGTPDGVGAGRKPPEFLKPGDVVTIDIDGIGTLTHADARARGGGNTVTQMGQVGQRGQVGLRQVRMRGRQILLALTLVVVRSDAQARRPTPSSSTVTSITVDARFSIAQAVAITGGKFTAVGHERRHQKARRSFDDRDRSEGADGHSRPRRRSPARRRRRTRRGSVAHALDRRRARRDRRAGQAEPSRRHHRHQQRLARSAAQGASAAVPARPRHRVAGQSRSSSFAAATNTSSIPRRSGNGTSRARRRSFLAGASRATRQAS